MLVWHLVAPDAWPAAGAYRPESLTSEGFVHFSFAEQVAGSANRHYTDAPALLAVAFDTDVIPHRVEVEDLYGTGSAYPHVYGPIDVSWAREARPLQRDAAGRWVFY